MQILNKCSAAFVLTLLITLLVSSGPIQAQQTVGLFQNDTNSFEGYTIFSRARDSSAWLIDNYGRLVHKWESGGIQMGSPYLLESGNVMWPTRGTGQGMHLFEFDWDGAIVWEYLDTNPDYQQHHDIQPMPNGNILVLLRDFVSAAEAFADGRDTLGLTDDTLWYEMVIEVQPTGPTSGTVVWQWTCGDHLIQDFNPAKNNFGVVEDHPELMDINFGGDGKDWLHSNALSYNADLDQIIISNRRTSEFWIVDHSTTTAEAAGHTGGNNGMGGDLIYRWGNPQVYRAGDSTDQTLFGQHHTHWIPEGLPGAGNFIAFSNGDALSGSWVIESVSPVLPNGQYPSLLPGEAYAPAAPSWTYANTPPEDFYAGNGSGATRLPNGNTLLNNAPGAELREVTPAGDIIWQYLSPMTSGGPVNQGDPISNKTVPRCARFAPDYPAFDGRDMTPTSALEIYPVTLIGTGQTPAQPLQQDSVTAITTEILADSGVASAIVMVDTGTGYFSLPLLDDGTQGDGASGDGVYGALLGHISVETLVSYYVEVVDGSTAAELVNDPPNPPLTVYRYEVQYSCGNIDGLFAGNLPVDVADLTFLVNYLFNGGPPPLGLYAANVDGLSDSGVPVDVADLTYLVAFLFQGGAAPACN